VKFVKETELKRSPTYLMDHTEPSQHEELLFRAGMLMSHHPTPLLDAAIDDILRENASNPVFTETPRELFRRLLYLEAYTHFFVIGHQEKPYRDCLKYTAKSPPFEWILQDKQPSMNRCTRIADVFWGMSPEEELDLRSGSRDTSANLPS
jgi:hypothetical protein